jgi:hypothetical protein
MNEFCTSTTIRAAEASGMTQPNEGANNATFNLKGENHHGIPTSRVTDDHVERALKKPTGSGASTLANSSNASRGSVFTSDRPHLRSSIESKSDGNLFRVLLKL